MKIRDKSVVITGAARGIGRALAARFLAEGARSVVVADRDADELGRTALEIGAVAVPCDVSREEEIRRLVDETSRRFGPIDLFCSNAGILIPGGVETPNEDWERIFAVNVKAHLWAARAVAPGMIERGGGCLLQVVSAAGLLTQIGSAPYAVTKHAALALAEWLAVTYGDRGLKVFCVCPQGVRTRMLLGEDGDAENFLVAGSIAPEDVAEAVIQGLDEERFLILPHPEVREYFRRKADDYDRWLRGMRRLRRTVDRSIG